MYFRDVFYTSEFFFDLSAQKSCVKHSFLTSCRPTKITFHLLRFGVRLNNKNLALQIHVDDGQRLQLSTAIAYNFIQHYSTTETDKNKIIFEKHLFLSYVLQTRLGVLKVFKWLIRKKNFMQIYTYTCCRILKHRFVYNCIDFFIFLIICQ